MQPTHVLSMLVRMLIAAILVPSLLLNPTAAGAASSDVASLLLAAANKTTSANSYEASSKIIITNLNAAFAEHNGVDQDATLIAQDLTGSYHNENAHITQRFDPQIVKDLYPASGIEVMLVDDEYYLHGPLPDYGAPEDRWYSGSYVAGMFASFNQRKAVEGLLQANLASFKQQATERIDGQNCTAYTTTDRKVAARVFAGMQGLDSVADQSRLLDPQVGVTLCDDGYVHKVTLELDYDCSCKSGDQVDASAPEVRVTFQGAPRQEVPTITYKMELLLSTFEKVPSIEAPKDAIPVVYEDEEDWEDDGYTAIVYNGGNIREEPTIRGKVLGQLHAGQEVDLIERTADGRWYLVVAPEAAGWVSASLLTLPEGAAEGVPIASEAKSNTDHVVPPLDTTLTAKVYNGGNVRSTPTMSGKVLDQINAGETVQLRQRSADGAWYQITNPRDVTGWVHKSLLTVDQAVAAKVPIAK